MKKCDFAEIVIKAFDIKPVLEFNSTFSDVSSKSPYAPYVYTGAKLGFWENPEEKSQFGCKKDLKRSEFAVMMAKIFGSEKKIDFISSGKKTQTQAITRSDAIRFFAQLFGIKP